MDEATLSKISKTWNQTVNLVNKNREKVDASKIFVENELIGLFFGAQWCQPCKRFTELLTKFYAEAKQKKLPIEIIFVSTDLTEKRMFEHMQEMDMKWCAVAFQDPLREQLHEIYNVLAVPTLVIIERGLKLVTKEARFDIAKEGIAAFQHWMDLSKKSSTK